MNGSKTGFFGIASLAIIGLLTLHSCREDDSLDTISLESYFAQNSNLDQVNALIACAAGGQPEPFTSTSHPISIFFLPEEGAHDFRYFETERADLNNMDFSLYSEVTLNDLPVFGDFLRYFERTAIDTEKWGIVTFVKDGNLHYSNPIRLKFPNKPTEFSPSLLTIDQTESLYPLFSWQDGRIDENVIYFHAITDNSGDLLSGTYTTDLHWRFYDLSNVVLNIRDVNPPPMLNPGEQYRYHMLGVSLDNWVNLIITQDFNTF